jgi:drug/metabolite transporter (DMT)-like permease
LTDTVRPLVWVAYLAALLGVMGHASSEFFVKLSGLQGAEVSVWRFMLGGASLLVVALATKGARDLITPLRESLVPILSLSLLGMALAQFLFHLALDYASVVQVATLVTVMPIFVVFVARIVEGIPITPPKIVSGIGAFLGCVLLLTDGLLDQIASDGNSLAGIGLSLGCAAIGATYLVLVKPYVGRYGAIRMTTYTFVLGFFALWLVVGSAWGIWVDPMTLLDREPVQYGAIIALGVWNTCIGFILWLWGLSNVPDVSRGNYLFFLKPVIAALLAVFILDDEVTLTQMAAMFVIIGFVAAEIFYDSLRGLFTKGNA